MNIERSVIESFLNFNIFIFVFNEVEKYFLEAFGTSNSVLFPVDFITLVIFSIERLIPVYSEFSLEISIKKYFVSFVFNLEISSCEKNASPVKFSLLINESP